MLFGQSNIKSNSIRQYIIDQTENAKFEHAELPLMRGECYGLRAFMHFDLVRLLLKTMVKSNASSTWYTILNDFRPQ